ncbi:uncharacterized protein LOC113169295 isoform X2 [Anabas testudineus]|uniref:uncharacterized protein LOC113169295 isoform X2 n=1 Tax=Anabas testudineus TaxID=64144 RepID=UPI000E4544E8|nr:uncharacterized protein LOC113169295 isoform X2 [Anabas testudineus]
MTVTVTMSAAGRRLTIILYLACIPLSASELSEVLWRDIGGAVTIHCRSSESDPKELNVKKGLSKDFLKVDKSNTVTMTKGLTHRLHVNATFPDVDILIQNLNMDDTGLYWCLYRKGDQRSAITENTNYSLLVVKEAAPGWLDISKENLVLMLVIISVAVLLSIMMGVLMWLIKTKTAYTAVKPRGDPNNVYEIMTGRCTEGVRLQVNNMR